MNALVFTSALADELSHTQARELRARGMIVALSQILDDARERYSGGRLLEAELEHEDGQWVYEVEFLDHNGELHELYYDATNGKLMFYENYRTIDGHLRGTRYDATTNEPIGIEADSEHKAEYEQQQSHGIEAPGSVH